MAGIAKKGNEKGSVKPAEMFLVPTYSPRKNQLFEDDESQGKYKCCACGRRFKNLEKNFPYSQSVFFVGNNNRLPICNECIDKFTDQYTELFDSQDEAIRRMALHWDMYVTDSLLDSSKKIDAKRSRIRGYISKCNLQQNAGKTYDTYLEEQKSDAITSIDDLEELKSDGKFSPSITSVERWGVGLSPDSYKTLDDHYKMLKKQNPSCDDNQEIFIKDLCYIKLQQLKAMKAENSDDFKTFTTLYRDTFKGAGLKMTSDVEVNADENPFDLWISDIENYTPAEYYADKNKYRDFFGIGEYIERHLFRPLKNFFIGSKDRDFEFNIDDGDKDA